MDVRNTNEGQAKCPQCGATLLSQELGGHCPACLLRQGAMETGPTGGAPFEPPSVEEMARLFPHLEVLGLIGKGGMGAVFQARQPALDRVVAVKVLPQADGEPGFRDRFQREARALAKLNHPNIVAVHEFGEVDGLSFFIMEFVDGLTLRQLERSGDLTPEVALRLVPQICEALQFAHDSGIVHRDIKPENILIDKSGRVKIADFGIAKIMGAAASELHLTMTRQAVGTPHYMAPEQVEQPQSVDHRADIFSLGVVFYEMLTGELPLGRFAPPSRKVAIDVRLDEIVLRALEKERELRYQQVSSVKTAVQNLAETPAPAPGVGSPGRRPGVPLSWREWRNSRKLPLVLLCDGRRRINRTKLATVAIALLLVTLSIWFVSLSVRPRHASAANELPFAASEQRNPRDVILETIRAEVGGQLKGSGATYEDLQVSVGVDRDSATPFKVAYRGLRGFPWPIGLVPEANGSFVMHYAGGGQWKGALGGKLFVVQVGKTDNIDLPFVDDPQVIGTWESVDFVADPNDFVPGQLQWPGELFFKQLTCQENGKTTGFLTWTKGYLLHRGDRTASHYEIRELQGRPYLFFEWKSGDVTIAGRKPHYYVLKKKF